MTAPTDGRETPSGDAVGCFTAEDVETVAAFANGWPLNSPEGQRIRRLAERVASYATARTVDAMRREIHNRRDEARAVHPWPCLCDDCAKGVASSENVGAESVGVVSRCRYCDTEDECGAAGQCLSNSVGDAPEIAERMARIRDALRDDAPQDRPWRVAYLDDVAWLLGRDTADTRSPAAVEALAAVRDIAASAPLRITHPHLCGVLDTIVTRCDAAAPAALPNPTPSNSQVGSSPAATVTWCPDCSRTAAHVHCPECGDTTHAASACDMGG